MLFDSNQDDSRSHRHQQRGFDYKDQYRRYQNFAYGKRLKKPTIKYVCKQPHTIYKKKEKEAIPSDEEKPEKSFEDDTKIVIAANNENTSQSH